MNLNKTKVGLFFLTVSMGYAHAQEAVPATGGDGNGTNGSVSYSVGQVVYTAGSGTNGFINQGVQQPYDISTNSIEDGMDNILLNVFPNPTKDVLILSIDDTDFSGYSYELYNTQGQLIRQEDVVTHQVNIPMHELNSATYILKVRSTDDREKSFTIIKH